MAIQIPDWLYNRQLLAMSAQGCDEDVAKYRAFAQEWREIFDIRSDEMQDWQKRVVTERDELTDKIEKLTVFMNNEQKMKGIPGREKSRMSRQLSTMCQYRNVLNERIEAFPPDPDEFIYAKLWFKANYLEMFLKKGWLKAPWIESLTMERDGKSRFECFCQVERKYIGELNTYCSTAARLNFEDPN